MTAATLTHLPLQVGGAVLASAGRAALWMLARYMRAPLTHTAIAALVGLSLAAGANALYGQRGEHPAPLFSPPAASAARPEVAPVIPADRPANLRAAPKLELKPAPAPIAETSPIGNKDVYEVQRKLEMLKLYAGEVDGIYGKRTAAAIRQFEQLTGRTPKGELSREVVDAILAAPLSLAEPKREALPAPVVPAVEATPAPVELKPAAVETTGSVTLEAAPDLAPQSLAALRPLAEPKPLELGLAASPAAEPERPTLLGRPLPTSADEAFVMAAETAEDALETIINGVQTVAMTRPGTRSAEPAEYAPAGAVLTATAPPEAPVVGVPLAIDEPPPAPGEEIAVLDTTATPEQLSPPFSPTDPLVVARVQRGLLSLGFLHGAADGVAGEATAKAIRNFETYFNFEVTGRVTPDLIDLLIENGAKI